MSYKTRLLRLFLYIALFAMIGCSGGHKLYGLVTDQDGKPVIDARVQCSTMSPVFLHTVSRSDCSTKTNRQGKFYINESASHMFVSILKPDYEAKRVHF